MNQDFEADVKAGNIFRKKVCQRCGAIDYEKYNGMVGHDWEEHPVYDGRGFGAIVIVPYAKGMERTVINLCPDCAAEFGEIIKNFSKPLQEEP